MNNYWLEFIAQPKTGNRKTSVYLVRNTINGIHAGMIYWYGGFRKYVFEANPDMIFDANCLREISAFLDELMAERKQTKKTFK